MAREIPYEAFKPWKNAYKNCKKQASIKIKDFYDNEFLDKIRNLYKETLKGKTEVDYKELNTFFETIISYTKYYLQNKKKWSKFYQSSREQAVKNLQSASENIVSNLKKHQDYADDMYDYFRYSQANIKVIKGVRCVPFVIDIPYLKYGFTTLRVYILVKGNGMLKSINGEFNPAKYELTSGEKYVDKNFDSRKIYKVSSIPINLPLNIGGVVIDVLISPNDLIARAALNVVSFDHELIPPTEL